MISGVDLQTLKDSKVNMQAVFVETLLVVTPSTVLACIWFIINVVPLLAG